MNACTLRSCKAINAPGLAIVGDSIARQLYIFLTCRSIERERRTNDTVFDAMLMAADHERRTIHCAQSVCYYFNPFLKRDMMPTVWPSRKVLVHVGPWFWNDDVYMRSVQQFFNPFLVSQNNYIFASHVAQHWTNFKDKSTHNDTVCPPSTLAFTGPLLNLVTRTKQYMRTKVPHVAQLDLFKISLNWKHPNVASDCTHLCGTPKQWGQLRSEVLRLL